MLLGAKGSLKGGVTLANMPSMLDWLSPLLCDDKMSLSFTKALITDTMDNILVYQASGIMGTLNY